MTAALPIPVRNDWTAEDLDNLPDDYRYEIVDGALIMTPSPTTEHQEIAHVLTAFLRRVAPPGWSAISDVDVVLTEDRRNTRRPDVVVYNRKHSLGKLRPEDLCLVVEIVSPSTKSQDRVMKPVQYAEAGIPCYWRVEQKPSLSVVEYQLTELGKYYEHSPRAGLFTVDKPWPIEIDLDAVAREAGLG
ncbi:MAG TPA: Uma2 family endonuclease [Micromonosporaceae bacterium]